MFLAKTPPMAHSLVDMSCLILVFLAKTPPHPSPQEIFVCLTDVPGQNTSSSLSPRVICLDLLMFLAKTPHRPSSLKIFVFTYWCSFAKTPPHPSPLKIFVLTYSCSWTKHLLIPLLYRYLSWLTVVPGQNTSSSLSPKDIFIYLLMLLAKTPPHPSPLEIFLLTYWCSWP